MKNYFWRLFEHTGNIDAYLVYRDAQRTHTSKNSGDINEQAEGTGYRY